MEGSTKRLGLFNPYGIVLPMSITTPAPFLSVGELAAELHVSRGQAYRLVRDREVPSTRFGGCIRIPRTALETWLADREREALASIRREEPVP